MTVERRDPSADYSQRGLWLALVIALVVTFGGGGAFYGGHEIQIWLYMASRVALGLSLLLCLLLVIPDLRARVGDRFRSERNVFALAFAVLVVALLISIASSIEGAIDALGEEPFR